MPTSPLGRAAKRAELDKPGRTNRSVAAAIRVRESTISDWLAGRKMASLQNTEARMRKRLGHHTKPLGDHQSQLHQEQAPRRLWSRDYLVSRTIPP